MTLEEFLKLPPDQLDLNAQHILREWHVLQKKVEEAQELADKASRAADVAKQRAVATLGAAGHFEEYANEFAGRYQVPVTNPAVPTTPPGPVPRAPLEPTPPNVEYGHGDDTATRIAEPPDDFAEGS